MENVMIKDLIALLRFYNDCHDDVAVFRLLSSRLLGIRSKDLSTFTKHIASKTRGGATLHFYDVLGRADELGIDAHAFHALKRSLSQLLSKTQLDEMLSYCFERFLLLEQAELLGARDRLAAFRDELLSYARSQDFLTIEGLIASCQERAFVLEDLDTVRKKVMADVAFLALRARFLDDEALYQKMLVRKKKVEEGSGDLDVAFFVGQIREDRYQKERELTRVPVFSVTQFNTYENCPHQYRLSYLYKVPQARKYYFVFGSVMHKVIEELTGIIKKGKEVTLPLARQILSSCWQSDGYESRQQEEAYRKDADVMLKRFLDKQAQVDTRLVDIERTFTVEVDAYKIYGIIDRVDVDENGDYVVIDYKTSKSEKDGDALRRDIQLLVYYDAVHKLYQKVPRLVGHWYLASDHVVSVMPTTEDLTQIRSRILSICTSIVTERFDPVKSGSCRFCDYKLLCPKW